MNAEQLRDLLTAEDARPVRPGPRLDPAVVRAGARRQVRRQRLLWASVSAAVVLAVGGVAAVQGPAAKSPAPPVVQPTPATTDLASVDWLDRVYPVSCAPVHVPTLRFTGGVATWRGYQLQVEPRTFLVVAQDHPSPPTQVEAVVMHCTGADSQPDDVLVYAHGASGIYLVGEPVLPASNTDVTSVAPVDGGLEIVADGYSPAAPHCCPDLTVTTSVRLLGTTLAVSSSTTPGLPQVTPTIGLAIHITPGGVNGRTYRFTANVVGDIPQEYSPQAGKFFSAADTEVLGTRIDWGDGSPETGSDPGDVTCKAGRSFVRYTGSFSEQHTYAAPGAYTVTFTTRSCRPGATGPAGAGYTATESTAGTVAVTIG